MAGETRVGGSPRRCRWAAWHLEGMAWGGNSQALIWHLIFPFIGLPVLTLCDLLEPRGPPGSPGCCSFMKL